jgi:hypothetical protein
VVTTPDSEDERGNPTSPWPWDAELSPGEKLHRETVANSDGTTSEEVTITHE